MGRIKVGAALATVVAIACAAQGLAAPGGALKHVNTVETLALRNAEGVAFAPNGKHVYGVGFAADGVAAFSRNANSGKLKLVDTESGNGLLGPTGVTVSPDNKTVPVAIISEMVDGDIYRWGSLMAGALFGSVPVALVYMFFVNHYVSAMTGAVKE